VLQKITNKIKFNTNTLFNKYLTSICKILHCNLPRHQTTTDNERRLFGQKKMTARNDHAA